MKNIFRLLLVMAIFGANQLFAIPPTEKPLIEFTDPGDVVLLDNNFVNLGMENDKHTLENTYLKLVNSRLPQSDCLNKFYDQQESFTQSLISDLNSKKEALFLSRIKLYIPDFDFSEELQRNEKRLFIGIEANETHYFLKHKPEDIRIITFIRNEKTIDFSPDNYSASISIEESYY